MNWVKRHLHWTLVLTCLATTLAASFANSLSPYEMRLWLATAIAYGLPLIPCAWILRQKGQSLWWLPVVWIPFIWWIYAVLYVSPSIPFIGWVVPLILRNRRQPDTHVLGGEEALATAKDSLAGPEMIAVQAPGPGLAVRIAGFLVGLVVAGCGIVMLKYMIGQVWAYNHGLEQVAYPIAVALSLFLTASLLIMPQRLYAEKPFVRTLAWIISACILICGTLAVMGGLFVGLCVEAADPGYGFMLIGAAIVAGGILGLVSGGVLCARVRATMRNRTGTPPSGSALAPRPTSG